jgi:hypothetical protein
MKGTVTKSALVCIGLKAGQQILHDMDPVVMNDTTVDVARFVTEQYIFRFGAPLVAAYALDKAVSCIEKLALPKILRGVLPMAAATIGVATAMHYGGQYMNMEPSISFTETITKLFNNYADNIAKLTTLNPEANGGYLTGATLCLMSGARWIKNIGESLANYAEKKEAQSKQTLEELA